MSSKGAPYRFTIRFNERDYQQQYVAELLNGMGRHKAQYITSAILHYVNCTKTPDIEQNQEAQLQHRLEIMVNMALEKLGAASKPQAVCETQAAPAPKPKRKHADVLTPDDTGTGLDGLNVDAIVASIKALNGK